MAADWAEYPLNATSYEPTSFSDAKIRQYVTGTPTFDAPNSEENHGTPPKVSLRIIDIKRSVKVGDAEAQVSCEQRLYQSSEEARQAISASVKSRIRIITIHSGRTVEPLRITEPLMQQIFRKYKVAPEFFAIVLSFGKNSALAENGNSNLYVQAGDGGSKRLSYEIRYVERNNRGGDFPWSARHTGVYHHHDVDNDFDLFILLQSNSDSACEVRLRDIVKKGREDKHKLSQWCQNPYMIHQLLFSSQFLAWRWYLRGLAQTFEPMNDNAMTVRPESPTLTYTRIQRLRHLQDRIIEARARCKGDLQVIQGLMRLDDSKTKELHQIQFEEKQLEGFIDSSELLRNRISNTIDLIGYTLDYHNQLRAAKQSTTITIITWVTAIYLPGTFAATFFGMNFFSFEDRNTIHVARDTFYFAVMWVALMILTYGAYRVSAKYIRVKPEEQPRDAKARKSSRLERPFQNWRRIHGPVDDLEKWL